MNRDDEFFMEMALSEAERSLDSGLMPVGVVIVRDNAVISSGRKTGMLNKRLDHAELMALQHAMTMYDDGHDMTLYSTLEPCLMCFATAANVKIARIVYALEDPYGGVGDMARCWRVRGNNGVIPTVTGSVKRSQAKAMFKKFFSHTNEGFWADKSNRLVEICFDVDTDKPA